MTLAADFRSTVVDALEHTSAGMNLLPLLFAQACVKVLPVDGAGLSMTDHLRIPLAASDDMAVHAERLQTTIGEGPCLSAATMTDPLVADAATMAARWPVFHSEFIRQTTYRSVASLPLRSRDGTNLGALDLYSADASPLSRALLIRTRTDIADPIAAILFGLPLDDPHEGLASSSWLNGAGVTDRRNVWVAVGMLMERLDLANADALAVLRGYAYSHQSSLDRVAEQLISKELPPEALRVN